MRHASIKRSLLAALGFLLPLSLFNPSPAASQTMSGAEDDRLVALSFVADDLLALAQPLAAPLYGTSDRRAERLTRSYGGFSKFAHRAGDDRERLIGLALHGRALLLAGRFEQAELTLRQTIAAAEKAGWTDVQASGLLADLASALRRAGRMDEALSFEKRALACASPCMDDALVEMAPIALTAFLLRHGASAEHAVSLRRAMLARLDSIGRAAARLDPAAAPLVARFRDALVRTPLPAVTGRTTPLTAARDRIFMDQVRFVDETMGPSRQLAELYRERAAEEEERRPETAYRHYRVAAGLLARSEPQSLARALFLKDAARHALRASEYYAAAEWAREGVAILTPISQSEPSNATARSYLALLNRILARAHWRIGGADVGTVFRVAVDASLASGDLPIAQDLMMDLIDARQHDQALRLAGAIIAVHPDNVPARLVRARVLADTGDLLGAATELVDASAGNRVVRLQRAILLERAGEQTGAAKIRTGLATESPTDFSLEYLNEIAELRDFGLREAASEIVGGFIPLANQIAASGTYRDAQTLWQIAYTMARGDDLASALRLMRQASDIALRLSLAEANEPDGGSLQLLRRDRFRYLLLIDILWGAATGQRQQHLLVSARY